MVDTLSSPAVSLANLVLEIVPEVHASPTPLGRRAALYDGLCKVTASLGGDSFALLQFTPKGTFDVRISAGYSARALSGQSAVDGRLLLRRLAASRSPIGLGQRRAGGSGGSLDDLGLDWVVGLPARSATRSRGVLVVTGRGPNPPGPSELRPLGALSGPLAMALDAPRVDGGPQFDPTLALRSARRRSIWSRWIGEMLGTR